MRSSAASAARAEATAGGPLGVGLTYWPALDETIEAHQDLIDVLEVQPEMLWYRDRSGADLCDRRMLSDLSARPLAKVVHGVGNPVGGSTAPDRAHTNLVADVVGALGADLVSEHLSFNRAPGPEGSFAGFMLPPRQTVEGVEAAVRSVRAMASQLSGLPCRFAVENGVSYLKARGDELSDGEFLAAVVSEADVDILLDLHNAFANQCNGRQAMASFVALLPLDRVVEIHLAGGQEFEGYWLDAHCGAIPAPVAGFALDLVGSLPNLRVINFEFLPPYLPRFGPDAIGCQLEVGRDIWAARRSSGVRPGAGGVARPRATVGAGAGGAGRDNAGERVPASLGPTGWERALAGTVTGPATGDDEGLGPDPGLAVLRHLVGEFRAGMVARALTLTTRLLVLHLGEAGTRALMAGFWDSNPPHAFAVEEAEAFVAHLGRCCPPIPHLDEVVSFELALLRAFTDGETATIGFAGDPEVVLGHLARGEIPPIPQSRRVELTVGAEY
ncbi:MAG: DUF692 domain-containing protein [Acidimicrobiales bacterium]